jgi:hypothetical protein
VPYIVGDGGTYNLVVYELGVDDDHPGDAVVTVPFTTTVDEFITAYDIRLDTLDAMIGWREGFWMGVENPTGSTDTLWLCRERNDVTEQPPKYADWGHSYTYTDTGHTTWGWAFHDLGDIRLDAFIRYRTIDPVAKASLSGPPGKNSSGNLYLDWADVSEAKDYLIYRSTNIDSPFPFLDSTDVSNYTDVGVVGSPATNYYYLLNTRHIDGGVYDKTSKAIGEFDKNVLNAK